MPSIALAHQVNGAMIAFIDGVEWIVDREPPAIHRRERVLRWDPWIEKAAYLEHAISDRFRIQGSSCESPQIAIAGIDFAYMGDRPRLAPFGVRSTG